MGLRRQPRRRGAPDAEAALGARPGGGRGAARRRPARELAPEPPARGSYESPAERDPFAVSLEEKLGVLAAADAGLRTVPKVALSTARFQAQRVDKLFASTDGALCEQRLTECGGGLAVVAVDGDESQIRSYPASHGGHVAQARLRALPGARPRRARAAGWPRRPRRC